MVAAAGSAPDEGRQMTEQGPSQYPSAGRPDQTTSGWAVGFILLRPTIMMIMVGIFQALQGLVAIFENEFVATRNYLFQFDATTWGWIRLIVGVIIGLRRLGPAVGAHLGGWSPSPWPCSSAIANFLFIPYYPFWSLLIIAVDVFVIWAIAAHGREVGV